MKFYACRVKDEEDNNEGYYLVVATDEANAEKLIRDIVKDPFRIAVELVIQSN